MNHLMYDYSREKHTVDMLGGLSALDAVKAQVEALSLRTCPFCGGEAVVRLGTAYGQPDIRVECSYCHATTVSSGPSYNYFTNAMTTMRDAIENVADRWNRRKEERT